MKLNKLIDHTYLKAFGTEKEINKLIDEAIKYKFKSVCVNPFWVKHSSELLTDTNILVCTVIGFPLGANTVSTKVFETIDAVKNGADEIDMVLNIGRVKAHDFKYIYEEVSAVKEACAGKTLKVILETCYLTEKEIKLASLAAIEAKADFIETSTGFGTVRSTVEDVKIMKIVAKNKEVKASGKLRSKEDLKKMLDAGATRIGTSSGISLIKSETVESDN